jgi:hypothetical protein
MSEIPRNSHSDDAHVNSMMWLLVLMFYFNLNLDFELALESDSLGMTAVVSINERFFIT